MNVPSNACDRRNRASSSYVSVYVRFLTAIGLLIATGLAQAQNVEFEMDAAQSSFLDDLVYRSFRYFWEQAGETGIVRDRALADGSLKDPPHPNVGSIAATGFGLTALCIAADRGYLPRDKAVRRVLTTLRFLYQKAPREHGWFYHYMDPDTGERVWRSEVSSIDTALLLAGVLTSGAYFSENDEIGSLARAIYEGIDFPWMLNGSKAALSHGWTPEHGFLPYSWDAYSELMILYMLAIASPTHPIPAESWYAWKRPVIEFEGLRFISGGPLFTHQYSHAWFDFRTLREKPPYSVNWYENSVTATRAQRQFCYKLSMAFPSYSADMWGITASDSAMGYMVWGEPPLSARIDGTIVPSAAGGSLMLAPSITFPALEKMHNEFNSQIYKRYGFVDAFNPIAKWVGPDVVGIDVGIILLSAENLRSGFVWKHFMATEAAQNAARLIGLEPVIPPPPGRLRRVWLGIRDRLR